MCQKIKNHFADFFWFLQHGTFKNNFKKIREIIYYFFQTSIKMLLVSVQGYLF